jgi:hypothetical protein
MANKPDAINGDQTQQLTPERTPLREEMRAALLRLRRLGENLPPIDAAAIVRESRDLAAQGNR